MVSNQNSIEPEETKTFKFLITEVHETGLCGSCGGCVSFCSAGDLGAIGFDDEGKPIFIDEENCLECGICYLICPQIDLLDEEIRNDFSWKEPIGSYEKIVSARSTDSEILKVCSDGGVVSSILKCLLERKMMDGAVVSKSTSNFQREPTIAQNYQDILDTAGSNFTGSGGVEGLGNYSTYSPTMFAIRDVKNTDLLRICVVGTPCQVHTIRKMQSLSVVPSDVVKLVLGLFCTENFAFDSEKKKEVERVLGVDLEDIRKLNIKEDVIVEKKDGSIQHIPLKDMDEFVRSACFACSDFANDFADISFGGLGSPKGWTTVVIRTKTGEAIFEEALSKGYIEVHDFSKKDTEHIPSEDMIKKITEFAKMKGVRAANTRSSLEEK
jgi:coenzyme F420 hydrogenase subunit beta